MFIRRLVPVCLGLGLTVGVLGHAQSSPTTALNVAVSNDVSRVPVAPDVVLSALPSDVQAVSSQTAVAAAESVWGGTDGQIDTGVGVVRALVSLKGDTVSRNIPGLIVVENIDTPNPAPGSTTRYSQMVVVVNAVKGGVVLSYPVSPVDSST